jgi:threonine dehydrogenase-like Zn-dependent dehydrogenase
MTTGRVAVLKAYGGDFELREYPVQDPEAGAILVRLIRAGVCGSDLHIWRGEMKEVYGSPPRDLTFGHEMCGRVARLGAGVRQDSGGQPLAEGDRVTFLYFFPCGRCPVCLRDEMGACPRKARANRVAGTPPYFNNAYGDYYYLRPGGFVFRIPDDVSDDVATPANCALAQVIYGLSRAGIRLGDTVVLQGAGGLGLNAAAVAKEMGAAQVIVIDQIPERLELARRFGADRTLSLRELPRPEDRVAAVKELTRGWGADVVCDFVGFPSVIPEGLQMLKSGGTYLEIGHISPGHKFEFHPASIVWRSHTIVGMIQYEPWAIQRALTFLEQNQRKYPFTEVISHVYPLDRIGEAFREAEWLGRQHSPHKISRAAIAPWGQ